MDYNCASEMNQCESETSWSLPYEFGSIHVLEFVLSGDDHWDGTKWNLLDHCHYWADYTCKYNDMCEYAQICANANQCLPP